MTPKLVIVLVLVGLVAVGMAETQQNASALGQNIYCDRDFVMGIMTSECEPGSTPVCHVPETTSSLICSCSNGQAQIHSYCGYKSEAIPEYQTVMSDVGLALTPSDLRLYKFSIDTYYDPSLLCNKHYSILLSPYSFTGPSVSVSRSSDTTGWGSWVPNIPSTSNWQLPITVRAMGQSNLCSTAITVIATLQFVPHYACNDIEVKSRMPCSDSPNCGPIPSGDPTSVRCSCVEDGVQVQSYCGSNKWENPKFTYLINGIGSGLSLAPSSYRVKLAVFYARRSTDVDTDCKKASFQLSSYYGLPVVEDPFNGKWYEQDLHIPDSSGMYFPMVLSMRMPSHCRTIPSTSPTAIITLRAPPPAPTFTPSPRPSPHSSNPVYTVLTPENHFPPWLIGVCVGGAVFVLVVIGLIIFCCLRCRSKRMADHHYEPINMHGESQNDTDALLSGSESDVSHLPSH